MLNEVRILAKFSGFLFVFFFPIVSFSSQNFSEHDKRIKQANDRINQQVRPLAERPDIFLQSQQQAETEQAIEASALCFQIDDIDLVGIKHIEHSDIELLTLSYIGECLGLAKINQLVEDISNRYIELGYVTTRAYISPQDLSDGKLVLQIVEGIVEDTISVDGSLTDTQLTLAIPVDKDVILNIRDIEQGLENLNQLRSNSVTVGLNPGQQQGGTVVAITNQPSSWWRGGLGLSNTGSESTGEYVVDANLAVDNLLGINDLTTLALSHNVGAHDLPDVPFASSGLKYHQSRLEF